MGLLDKEPPPKHWPNIGDVDRITSVPGERGMGKSTFAMLDAREFRAQTGAYVIGHSPDGMIGGWSDIEFHDSIKSLSRGLTKRPAKFHFVASGSSVEETIEFARSFAAAVKLRSIRAAGIKVKPHRPLPRDVRVQAPPTLLVVDEGMELADRSGAGSVPMELWLTRMRHEHMAFTYLNQAPTARAWRIQEQANRFRVFRYTHEWGNNALRAAGIDKDEISKARTLPQFAYLAWDKEDPAHTYLRRLPKNVEAPRDAAS